MSEEKSNTGSEIVSFAPGTAEHALSKGEMKVVSSPTTEAETHRQMESAKKIFGKHFFGPDEISKALRISIPTTEIPQILFSEEELKKGVELNQSLILRIDKTKEGDPITLQSLDWNLKTDIKRRFGADILRDEDKNKFAEEMFFISETPRPGWVLVSNEVMKSRDGHYLDQTQSIYRYLKRWVFDDVLDTEIPKEYQDAMKEFEEREVMIERALENTLSVSQAYQLTNLKINQLTRHTAVEALYDHLLLLQLKGIRLFQYESNVTSSLTSDHHIVTIGEAYPYGSREIIMAQTTPSSVHMDMKCFIARRATS